MNEYLMIDKKAVIGTVASSPTGTAPGTTFLAEPGQRIILVLQRGWVAVGIYSQAGEVATLSDASIVRRWGTTAGLGELAQKGPLDKTKMDRCPDISCHVREVVFAMRCSDAWR